MKKILFILAVFALNSCGLEYDGETKLTIQGQLIDANNNPLSNIFVETNVSGNTESDVISYTKTDANGNFRMTFSKPVNPEYFSLHINDYSYNYLNTNSQVINILQYKTYRELSDKDFINYKFDIGKQTLYNKSEITSLKITFVNTSYNYYFENQTFEIVGLRPLEDIYLQNNYQNMLGYYGDNYNSIQVVKNQTIIFKFNVRNITTNQVETLSETILINSDDEINHTINL
jgi:hypothetical protein